MNLKELSQKLGLSQTTVSRALGGYPEVKASTRALVKAAAKKYNYSPSRRATSLATGRSMTIGHVIPMAANHEMVNPVFSDFITGATDVYAQHGYDALLSVVRDEDQMQAYRDLAQRSSVDGIIVHGPKPDDPRLPLLDEIGIPYVVHGRTSAEAATHSFVDVDNAGAFRIATEHLIEHGHREIGLINGLETMDFAVRRREGYLAALAAAAEVAPPPDPEHMASDEMTEQAGHAHAARMLDLPNPPTAFLTSSILMAIGARRAAWERGLVMGEDISIMTHDDALSYLQNGYDSPVFSSILSPVRAAGRRCAEILMAHIKDPDSPPVQEIWQVTLRPGPSVTAPKPRALSHKRPTSAQA